MFAISKINKTVVKVMMHCLVCFYSFSAKAQDNHLAFKVIAFYTAKNDQAHIIYVHEANMFFS